MFKIAAPLLLAASFAAFSLFLIHRGLYGFTLFLLIPVFLGALAAWVSNPKTASQAAAAGALAVTLGTLSLFAIGKEGMICIAMALPLTIPLGILGGLLFYQAQSSLRARRGAAMLLLLPPATFTFDTHAQPPLFEVRSSIEIDAPPQTVWSHVVTFSELPEPEEWFFRAGLAYPIRARIDGAGPGAIRRCEFSTGPFIEPIEVWDAPRLLRFSVTENPAPMHEWSPYAHVLPKHLHGYLVSKQGQFQLTPLPGNRTLLEGTTWYQHGLWPAHYWRWWSDAIIHRIHRRVLAHIRNLSEQAPSAHASPPSSPPSPHP